MAEAPTEAIAWHRQAKIELSWIEHDLRVAQERRDLLVETVALLESLAGYLTEEEL